MSQVTYGGCCSNLPIYRMTFEHRDTLTTMNVCGDHIKLEHRFEDRILRPYQADIVKIICVKCDIDVTATKGCISCGTNDFGGNSNGL